MKPYESQNDGAIDLLTICCFLLLQHPFIDFWIVFIEILDTMAFTFKSMEGYVSIAFLQGVNYSFRLHY